MLRRKADPRAARPAPGPTRATRRGPGPQGPQDGVLTGRPPAPGACARVLEERRELQELERKIAGEHWAQAPDHDLIFSSEHGGMIDPTGFSRTFDRLVKRAGVRRITVRLARHTCGTLLAFLKVHPKVAQAILRHSQISMTMDVYTHVVGDSEREAVGMLAELLEDPLIG
ncbi:MULTISPECIES: tyrosine-type recombinase/integrase [Streptomyces]|uniref:tyrosine-type recombinase/integrase n=1 Tax=Streptomyces TaxID=1883 RepID=UPI002161B728|nr:tyrosine-type recombinase/integrase [Streptomyces sp. M7]